MPRLFTNMHTNAYFTSTEKRSSDAPLQKNCLFVCVVCKCTCNSNDTIMIIMIQYNTATNLSVQGIVILVHLLVNLFESTHFHNIFVFLMLLKHLVHMCFHNNEKYFI